MPTYSAEQLNALGRLGGLSYYNLVQNPDRTRVYAQARENLAAFRAGLGTGGNDAGRLAGIAVLEQFLGQPVTVTPNPGTAPGHVSGVQAQQLALLGFAAPHPDASNQELGPNLGGSDAVTTASDAADARRQAATAKAGAVGVGIIVVGLVILVLFGGKS